MSGTIVEYPDAYDTAVRERIKANATTSRRRKWYEADETRKGLIEWLQTAPNIGSFGGKMLDAYREWGCLTEGQEAAVRKMRGEASAKAQARLERDQASGHVGAIGQRGTFGPLTVEGVFGDEGPYGATFAHKFRDAAGNIFHWRTGRQVAERGETVTLTATVKAHHVSKAGVKATILTRAKVEGGAQ